MCMFVYVCMFFFLAYDVLYSEGLYLLQHRAENGSDEVSVSRGSVRGQISRRTLEKQPIPALGCRSKINWMALISGIKTTT